MDKFAKVDEKLTSLLVKRDDFLVNALRNSQEAGLPSIEVSPAQGQFLYFLTKLSGAKRVLEIGTLAGYSTLFFAKGLLDDDSSEVVTLEYDPQIAKVAHKNFEESPYRRKIRLLVGEAKDSLMKLVQENVEPFDIIFIDADKANNPLYLDYSLQLAKTGSLIIADNIIREGEILNENSSDERVIGIQQYLEKIAAESSLESVAIATIGIKGIDGFSLSIVTK
ncbi:O-methyltransferase [Listeria aquatica]|uniref:O-methyltransferase n=1 Tax=Listeria aquatica TaxID=1494960 RepID=UPI003EF32630